MHGILFCAESGQQCAVLTLLSERYTSEEGFDAIAAGDSDPVPLKPGNKGSSMIEYVSTLFCMRYLRELSNTKQAVSSATWPSGLQNLKVFCF